MSRWLKGGATSSYYSLHKVRRFLNSIKNLEGSKPLEPFREEREQTKKKDINYLKQCIMALNDIEELDPLVTELSITAQIGKLMRDARNIPF